VSGEAATPFTDAHVHFWDHSLPGMRWRFLEPDFDHPRLKGTQRLDAPRYTPVELLDEAEHQAPSKLVHVQCAMAGGDPVQETRWLESLAHDGGFPTAIVAGCNVRDPEAGVAMQANVAASPRMRGVRDLTVAGEVDPAAVRPAFDSAHDLGLSIELMLPVDHYSTVARLAEAWPGVTIVLGHAGQPIDRSDASFDRWTSALAALAGRVPNVVLKLSAIASSADPRWTTESIAPWVSGAIDGFGPHRCMFASNWPIDRLYGTYPRLVAAYRSIVSTLPQDDQAALLHGTADRVYRI
jgi:predicted TIM-barrel fold metal-dependent hydrolase